MILNFLFRNYSLGKQMNTLRHEGVMLGVIRRDGRTVHFYMLRNLFVEVTYRPEGEEIPEKLNILRGIKKLNLYLENAFKASF